MLFNFRGARLVLALVFAALLMGRPAEAQWRGGVQTAPSFTACEGPRQHGCVDILVVQTAFKTHPTIVALTRGTIDNNHPDVTSLHQEINAGRVSRLEACRWYKFYFWGVNDVPYEYLRQFDGWQASGLKPEPVSAVLPVRNGVTPSDVFRVRICKGAGGLRLPPGYVTANTFAIICPEETADVFFPVQLPPQPGVPNNGIELFEEHFQDLLVKSARPGQKLGVVSRVLFVYNPRPRV